MARFTKLGMSLAFILIFGCLNAAAQEKSTQPTVVISGADSRIRKPTYKRISAPEELSNIYADHLGKSHDDAYRPLLAVDFANCMVVAIFRGEQVNCRGMEIHSVLDTPNGMKIRFNEVGYQTAGKSNDKPPDRPYAIVVLPKSSKPIVLEEDAQIYKGRPPEWKECAKLP